MNFDDAAGNFIVLITAALTLLYVDLHLYIRGRKTFSESIWGVNQWTLALAFAIGLLAGHLCTVPG